ELLQALLAVAVHRSEFERWKADAVLAETLLPVENRPLRIELDEQSEERQKRQDEDAADDREHEVDRALGGARTSKQQLAAHLEAEHAAQAPRRGAGMRDVEQLRNRRHALV